LTTNVHTPARTTPYTLTHNSIAYAQRITTHHAVSKIHSLKIRAKVTQPRNFQWRNQ
jgi:hypothetical protein